MPAVNNLESYYKLLLRGVLFGQEVLNRFYYAKSIVDPVLDAIDLINSWVPVVVPELVKIVSQNYEITAVETENLGDPLDFATVTGIAPNIGERPGTAIAPFGAWGYEFATADKRIRSGGKRFAGVAEEDINQGELDPASPVAAEVTAFGNFLNIPVVSAAEPSGVWIPALFTFGNVATGGLPWFSLIAGAPYKRLTTQNTRKFGRGS